MLDVSEPESDDVVEEDSNYLSFGFVEVGETPDEAGGYTLNRSSSNTSLSTEALLAQQRRLERELEDLRVEFTRLKERVTAFEAENLSSWSLRYSQRMSVMANISLAVWIFWSRFVKYIRRRRSILLHGVVLSGVLPTKKNIRNKEAFNVMLMQGYLFAIKHCWVLFIAAFLLTRRESWKRYLGLVVSTLNSLYIAFFTNNLPWTSYFVIFANLLYATASLQSFREERAARNLPTLFEKAPSSPKNRNGKDHGKKRSLNDSGKLRRLGWARPPQPAATPLFRMPNGNENPTTKETDGA